MKTPQLNPTASFSLPSSRRRFATLLAASAFAIVTSPSWATVLWQWEPSTVNNGSPASSSVQSFSSPLLDSQSNSGTGAYQFSTKSAETVNEISAPSAPSTHSKLDLAAELDAFDDGKPQPAATVESVESVKVYTPSNPTAAQFGEAANSQAIFAAPSAPVVSAETTTMAPSISSGKVVHTSSLHQDVRAVPEMSAFFPILGLLAAVSSTHLLRRRRLAQQARAQATA